MSKVVVIATGGTIAMRYSVAKGGAVSATNGNDLVCAIPALKNLCPIEVIEFSNIPSFHITPAIMLHLAQTIEMLLARADVRGIVVTHGTDTLEETAYLLDHCLASAKPVCFTGAMRHSSEISPDGPYNIFSAVLAASSPLLEGYGVVAVMNGEIHAASQVTKMHKNSVQTFVSPECGPLGHIYEDTIFMCQKPPARTQFFPQPTLPNVPILKVYSGMDETLFEALLATGMQGLVIEGFGVGNVPKTIIPYIQRIMQKNIPIVITSRVPMGKTLGVYAVEGGSKHLQSLGVLLGGVLSSQKARIKLMLLLTLEQKNMNLQSFFNDRC